nr:fibronectin type III domain-containing protein [Saprospiraceae bacterium]
MRFHILYYLVFISFALRSQDLPSPTILEVVEDDRVATLYWNSRTDIYDLEYDPDKREGIYSYLVEWGKVGAEFAHKVVTPYRAFQVQPLDPDAVYRAQITALDPYGRGSTPSEEVVFGHDPSRVDAMRQRLDGFFDDMNTPKGPFDEKKWNQAYSGCMRLGYISQHINHQYHGHNVIASGHCDRGMASSRARELFDFRGRTGTIEFDLDGAHMRRHSWYLDIIGADRTRDVTGHINSVGVPQDPAHFLRIEESGSRILIYVADENGVFNIIPDAYRNGACGERLVFCPDENLEPLINVRRHWRIELSKTDIRIYIDDILVVDGNLITSSTPEGLDFEVAQLNWLSFSYNTNKENLIMSMIHWDNFGFDAPEGFIDSSIVHNYTDGMLGTETPLVGNEGSIGMAPQLDDPGTSIIPIPDQLKD